MDGEQRTYRLRLHLENGNEHAAGELTTRRPLAPGDIVNIPKPPDGESEAGRGHVWRVVAIENDDTALVLTYERSA